MNWFYDEHSTFDWVLRGMIERAGFTIETAASDRGMTFEFICRKIRQVDFIPPPVSLP